MLLGFLGVFAFGLTLPATRLIVSYFDPLFIGLGRAVLAALVAGLLLVATRQPLPHRHQLRPLVLTALGVVIGFPVFSSLAMETVPASHGGVVLGILPLATALAGTLLSHERPSIGFWVTGVVGCAMVLAYTASSGLGGFEAGDVALLAAVVSAAFGYAVGGWLAREMGGWQVTCWALVIALPFVIVPFGFYLPESILTIPLEGWLGLVYLGLFSQLFGFFFWYRGLALGGVARVSQVQLLQPFITILVSTALLKEVVDVKTLVYASSILMTVAVSRVMAVQR